MDGGTIQQALLMILNVVIAALVSALTALGISYFRTRGQNLATKHDFDELLNQLKANTQLVEMIKSEVGQRDWAQREWTTLRRVKLEALLEKMHECEAYVDRRRDSAMDGKVSTPERDPVSELDALKSLYFPELENEVYRFTLVCRQQNLLSSQYGLEISKIGQGIDPTAQQARQSLLDSFRSEFFQTYQEFLNSRSVLTPAARSLLERIMNVDEQTAPNDER
jgi:hypothetical protein